MEDLPDLLVAVKKGLQLMKDHHQKKKIPLIGLGNWETRMKNNLKKGIIIVAKLLKVKLIL